MRIGVIIPTLDEEAFIERTLAALLDRGTPAVTVVSDCGSQDRTAALARKCASVIVVCDPALDSRAAAMNAGAVRALQECADLEVLWFLHADSLPPERWDERIADALRGERVVGGAFDFMWDLTGVGPIQSVKLSFFGVLNRVRFRLTRIYFGDQGIFVRRAAFDAVGGMPRATLLEDVMLCRQLKRLGRLRPAAAPMRVSPRRFLRHGVCRQVLVDTGLLLAQQFGLRPKRLHEWYNHEKA